MTGTAHYRVVDDVALIELDHAPVNALSYELRSALIAGLNRAADDPAIAAIVIIGAHGVFCGGADLRQLDTPLYWQYPRTIELAARLDEIGKPVVAAIGALAMGGGLELALGCHYRVCRPDSRLALPEVKLGLMPGGGGTLRLPRLIGVEQALRMMLDGESIDAQRAARWGLIDLVASQDLQAEAIAYARRQGLALAARRQAPRRARDLSVDIDRALDRLAQARRQLASGADQGRGPHTIVDCIEAGLIDGWDEAVERTAQATAERMASPEAKAHRYQFFAQREAARVDPADPPVPSAAPAASASRPPALKRLALQADASGRCPAMLVPLLRRLEKAAVATVLVGRGAGTEIADVDLLVVGLTASPGSGACDTADAAREGALRELRAIDERWPDTIPLLLVLDDGEFRPLLAARRSHRPWLGLRLPGEHHGRIVEIVAIGDGTGPWRAALARLLRQTGWQPVQCGDGPHAVAATLRAALPAQTRVDQEEALPALRAAGRELVARAQVRRISDIDVVLVAGLGYPAHRGGPFHPTG